MSKYIVILLIVTVSCSLANAGTATWTALGSDDRWTNPDNWQGGIVPTANDDIAFAGGSKGEQWANRHSVTIDGEARANTLYFYDYSSVFSAFQNINIASGANYVLNSEFVDQGNAGPCGTYNQTGGTHIVNGNFRYSTFAGNFTMTGGVFTIAGTFAPAPESGHVTIMGGTVQASTMQFGHWGKTLSIGGSAYIGVQKELAILNSDMPDWAFDCPIHMLGADFVNYSWTRDLYNELESLQLIFEGGLASISSFEVGGTDYGPDQLGFVDNHAIALLDLGGLDAAHVQLVDNGGNKMYSTGPEALYVDTLAIESGSILDLNGYNLYCKNIIDNGGTFLNGTPVLIPEPATLLLLGLGAVMLRRKR